MVKKKAQITPEATDEMFGDILDRLSQKQGEEVEATQEPTRPRPTHHPKPKSKSPPIKVSLYLAPEDVDALDQVIIQKRKETGKSPRRTHLIREAIHAWLEQQR